MRFYDDLKIKGFNFPEEAFLFESVSKEKISLGTIINHNNKYYRVMYIDFMNNQNCTVQEIELNFCNYQQEDTMVKCPVCGNYIQDSIEGDSEEFECEICGSYITAEKIITYVTEAIEIPEVIDL